MRVGTLLLILGGLAVLVVGGEILVRGAGSLARATAFDSMQRVTEVARIPGTGQRFTADMRTIQAMGKLTFAASASNRLTLAIILAAIIIGSSLIIQTQMPPLLMGYPALGLLGFLISAVLGMGLVIAILRSGGF